MVCASLIQLGTNCRIRKAPRHQRAGVPVAEEGSIVRPRAFCAVAPRFEGLEDFSRVADHSLFENQRWTAVQGHPCFSVAVAPSYIYPSGKASKGKDRWRVAQTGRLIGSRRDQRLTLHLWGAFPPSFARMIRMIANQFSVATWSHRDQLRIRNRIAHWRN